MTSLLDQLEAERRDSERKVMTSGHSLRQLESEMAACPRSHRRI